MKKIVDHKKSILDASAEGKPEPEALILDEEEDFIRTHILEVEASSTSVPHNSSVSTSIELFLKKKLLL